MTTTMTDTQKKIRKMIKEQTVNLYLFWFISLLLIFPRLYKKEIYNSTFIIGLFLFFISIVYFNILTMRRRKILKSINLNDNAIVDTVKSLTSFKQHSRRLINFLWIPLFLLGFYMIIWDDIGTDTVNGRYLFIAIFTIIPFLISLPFILSNKNPVDHLIDDLNSLTERN
jgi:hypothetical protein